MALVVEKLSRELSYGKAIRGITMKDLSSPETREKLKEIFVQDGLVVFKDCSVSHELHIALSEAVGKIAIHPLAKEMPVDGHPELIMLKYEKETETQFDVNGEVLGGYIPWHFDGVFTLSVNRGGILRIETPSQAGGDTGFLDRIDVYNTLPKKLAERIESLEVVYGLDIEYRFPYIPNADIKLVQEGSIHRGSRTRFEAGELPLVVHPLVCRQLETGRKILNFSPHMARTVLGVEREESDDLLHELATYATDESRAYFHHWHTKDELVLWDNYRMLHKACGVPANDVRAVVRTTISGDYYAHGRVLGH